jgi:hypothetical protein
MIRHRAIGKQIARRELRHATVFRLKLASAIVGAGWQVVDWRNGNV